MSFQPVRVLAIYLALMGVPGACLGLWSGNYFLLNIGVVQIVASIAAYALDQHGPKRFGFGVPGPVNVFSVVFMLAAMSMMATPTWRAVGAPPSTTSLIMWISFAVLGITLFSAILYKRMAVVHKVDD